MAMAMRRTTANSPTQALSLMDQLEPGPILDQATVGLVGHLADFTPQAAFTCASQIMDAALPTAHSTQRRAIMEMARIDLPATVSTLKETKLRQKLVDRIHRDVASQLGVTFSQH